MANNTIYIRTKKKLQAPCHQSKGLQPVKSYMDFDEVLSA